MNARNYPHTRYTDIKKPLLLFAAALGLQFFVMPFHNDPSFFVVLSTLAGIWAWQKKESLSTITLNSSPIFSIFSPPIQKYPLAKLARFGFYALAFFCIISIFSSIGHADSLRKIPRVGLWLAFTVCGVLLSRLTPRHHFFFLYFLVASLFCSALLGLTYWLAGHPEGLLQEHRLKLFTMHPSRLAFLCSIAFFYLLNNIFYPLLYTSRTRFLVSLAIHFMGIALLLALLIASNTRSIILCLGIGIIWFFLLLDKKHWKMILSTSLLIIAFCTIAFMASKDTQTTRRLTHAVTKIQNDPTFQTRLPIWEAGLEAFFKKPLLGNGLYSFRRVHAEFIAEHKERLDSQYAYYEKAVKHAHNIVLGRLVDSGIVGTLAFFGFFLAAFIRAHQVPPPYRWLSAFFVFSFCAGMLDDFLWMGNNSLLFLFAAAILTLPTTQCTPPKTPLPES